MVSSSPFRTPARCCSRRSSSASATRQTQSRGVAHVKCHLISGRGQHAQHCRTTLAAPTRIIWGPRCAEEKDDPCVVSRETEVVLAISPIPRSRQACLLPHIKPETGHRPLPTTNRTADTGHVTARKTTQSGAARPTHRPFRGTSRLTSHLSPHASLLAIRHSPLATRQSPLANRHSPLARKAASGITRRTR